MGFGAKKIAGEGYIKEGFGLATGVLIYYLITSLIGFYVAFKGELVGRIALQVSFVFTIILNVAIILLILAFDIVAIFAELLFCSEGDDECSRMMNLVYLFSGITLVAAGCILGLTIYSLILTRRRKEEID